MSDQAVAFLKEAAKRTRPRLKPPEGVTFPTLEFGPVETFNCPAHGEYRGRTARSRRGVFPPGCRNCSREGSVELARAMNRDARIAKAKIDDENQRRAFGNSGIPESYKGKNFGNYRADVPGQREAKAMAENFLSAILNKAPYWMPLTFIGSTGTGKTHLMCAIANGVFSTGRRVLYQTAGEAVDAVYATYNQGSKVSKVELMGIIESVDLLIIDEVGAGGNVGVLTEIVDKRNRAGRPIIFGGNVDHEGLRLHAGARVFSRLHENGGFIVMDWDDHRRKKRVTT